MIRDRELGEVWKTMLDAMREAASLSPWIVMNGDTDGIAFLNHLSTQGPICSARAPRCGDHKHPGGVATE